MWSDEMASIGHARVALADLPDEMVRADTHPPLYYLLLWFWYRLGKGDVWLRLLSLALGLSTVLAVYVAARMLGGPRWATASGALAALSPGLIWPSQEVRSYVLGILLVVVSYALLVRVLRGGALWLWIALGLSEMGAVLSFYFALLPLIPANAYLLWLGIVQQARQGSSRLLRGWGTSVLAAMCLFALWAPFFLQQLSHVGADTGHVEPLQAVRKMVWETASVTPLDAVNSLIERLGVSQSSSMTIVIALGALGILWLANRRCRVIEWTKEQKQGVLLAGAMALGTTVLAPLIVLAFGVTGQWLRSRYFVVIDGLGALVAGGLIASMRPRALGLGAGVALCVLLAASLPELAYQKKEPWKEAAVWIDRHVAKGDCMIGVQGDTGGYAYYGHSKTPRYDLPFQAPGVGRQRERDDWLGAIKPGDIEAISALLSKYERVIAIWSHSSRLGEDRGEEILKEWFAENRYVVIDSTEFVGGRGVRIEIFARQPEGGKASGKGPSAAPREGSLLQAPSEGQAPGLPLSAAGTKAGREETGGRS